MAFSRPSQMQHGISDTLLCLPLQPRARFSSLRCTRQASKIWCYYAAGLLHGHVIQCAISSVGKGLCHHKRSCLQQQVAAMSWCCCRQTLPPSCTPAVVKQSNISFYSGQRMILGQPRSFLAACTVHGARADSPGRWSFLAGRFGRLVACRTASSSPEQQLTASVKQHARTQPVQPQAGPSVGALLLQQPASAHVPVSLGAMLLQQPYMPLPRQQSHSQQWQQQQEQFAVNIQPQVPQQQKPRAAAGRPPKPAALTAREGYVVSRLQQYTAPEAVQLQGKVWSEPTLDELETAVLQMSPEAVVAAARKAAADAARVAGPDMFKGADAGNSYTYTGSRPQLYFALQAVTAEQQVQTAADNQQGSANAQHSSSSGGGGSSSTRPAEWQGSAAGPLQRGRRIRRTSSVKDPSAEGTSAGSGQSPVTDSQCRAGNTSSSSTSTSTSTSDGGGSGSSSRPGRQAAPKQQCYHNHNHRHHQQQQQQPPVTEWESEEEVLLRLHESMSQRGLHISPQRLRFGQHRLVCPFCEGGSTGELSMAITLQEDGVALWCCHRATCGETGGFRLPALQHRPRRHRSSSSRSSCSASVDEGEVPEAAGKFVPQPLAAEVAAQLQPLSADLLAWLEHERKISRAVLQRNRVGMVHSYDGPSIAFPYYQAGVLVNIKYRTRDKRFLQAKGGQQVFYGVDDLQGAREVIIVEGELDKLALETAFTHPNTQHTLQHSSAPAVLSLPAGAVAMLKQGQPNPHSKKLACIDRAAVQLAGLQRIIIAVDGDGPGQATAEALKLKLQWRQPQQQQQLAQGQSHQQGPAQQLLYLPWPTAPGGGEVLRRVAQQAAQQGLHIDVAAVACCKDANDVLRVCGPQVLKMYINHAQPL